MSIIISPYKNLIQYSRIQLQPYQLNSDIESNMELVLQQKLEKKCNRYGYIDKIYRITEYEEGIMRKENLSGVIDYNITFECRICLPVENTVIIGKIMAINQELVLINNGPIIIFIPKGNIDTNIWNISSVFTNKKTDKVLSENNLVKVLVTKIKINQNDTQIKCIGNLLDTPTDKEVEEYYGIIINEESEDELSEDENVNKDTDNFIL